MATPLDYFKMEAFERLERLSSGLMALERSPDDPALIGDLFREAHSLKGAAGVSGLPDIAEICHKMEDLLSSIREESDRASAGMIDALLATTDAVQELIVARVEERECDIVPAEIIERLVNLDLESAGTAATSAQSSVNGVTAEAVAKKSAPEASPESGKPTGGDSAIQAPALASETVRLRVDMLESLGNLTGELMVAGDRLRERLGAFKSLDALVRGQCNRGRDGQDVEAALRSFASTVRGLIDECAGGFAVLEPLIAEIHEQVLNTRMLPVSPLFDGLQRFVRDYCRQENKRAELHIQGADTRVDRRVLEQLRDPMIHLIRNALSHGIEPPEEREGLGKNPVGAVRLTISRRGDRIRITCEDDGRGIDRQRVLAKAISAGIVSMEEAAELAPNQIESLILRPGLSTTELITDVSGRGVGLDVVARCAEALRGTLEIGSEPGRWTRFVLEFAASVATLEGLLVEAAGHTYVVPTASVVRTAGIRLAEVQTVGGETMADIDGQVVPLVMLADLLGRTEYSGVTPNLVSAVVVRHREDQIAVGVERLLGTQIVVAKSLGDHVGEVCGVSGATILGTGLPALILDLGRLVQGGPRRSPRAEGPESADTVDEELAPILIVDDSITTRMMEQSILESAGYNVDSAVSAEDALEKIERFNYRLFVVDVEMPGLDGFQLTRQLRQDERFAETPIIIVTSLAKEGHRREGLEAGANAYISKGEFDQKNLLETVERLVG